jgi:hypothetical protein
MVGESGDQGADQRDDSAKRVIVGMGHRSAIQALRAEISRLVM